MTRDEAAGLMGLVAVAAGAHAGVLMMAVGLRVPHRELVRATRRELLRACYRVVRKLDHACADRWAWDIATSYTLAAASLEAALDALTDG